MMGLSIALTKGRLEKQTVSMLEDLGYGIEALKDKGRALVFKDSIEDIQYFLVKSNDCITYVNHGVADIGVVGKDTILENENDTYELLDLKIGKCKFIVASLTKNQLFSKVGHIKIGTKYPTVAKQYFLSKGMDAFAINLVDPAAAQTVHDKIKAAGYDITTPVIVSNTGDFVDVSPCESKHVSDNDIIISLAR